MTQDMHVLDTVFSLFVFSFGVHSGNIHSVAAVYKVSNSVSQNWLHLRDDG